MYNRNSKFKIQNSKLNSSQVGQTLLELIIVIAVSVIVIGALVFTTIYSLRNAQFSKNQAQATKLAQEGIEKVRAGRDMNQCITSLANNVNSWNGNAGCPGNFGSIWNYHIFGNCEIEQPGISGKCYFNISTVGALQNEGFASRSFPLGAERIPPATGAFQRVAILSDKNFPNDDYQNAKEVTVIVRWTDFSGTHESRLTTILRRL